jgi:nitroreductase
MKNEVLKTIYERRSVRKYKDEQIPKELINEIINAGIMAPSARNGQPWKFSVVTNKKIISDLDLKACNACIDLGYEKEYNRDFKQGSIFYSAPLLIFISGNPNSKWIRDDTNLAIQNMFLAAKSIGIGSCWIGLAYPLYTDSETKKLIGVEENDDIIASLVFGYPLNESSNIPNRTAKILKWMD